MSKQKQGSDGDADKHSDGDISPPLSPRSETQGIRRVWGKLFGDQGIDFTMDNLVKPDTMQSPFDFWSDNKISDSMVMTGAREW